MSDTARPIRVREDLRDVAPYGAPQLDVPVRLNTNETATPPPAVFTEELAKQLAGLTLNRYPDRDHRALREALAARVGRNANELWAANGSNEILLQLLQAYGGPGRTLMFPHPSYSMYPELCRTTCTNAVSFPLDAEYQLSVASAIAAVEQHKPDLIIVPSPNNPVGTLMGRDALVALHDHSQALLIVDEAYIEFAAADASTLPLFGTLERLVIVRTFSKAFRLAGLRLGYLIAPAWVVDDLQTVRLPYHLDTVKQIAAITAITHEQAFLTHRQQVADERERLTGVLRQRGDVTVYDSAANFFLLRSHEPHLFAKLLDQGVLVRDFSTVTGLERCVRVTIGTPEENDRFLAAVAAVLDATERTAP
jgi:histidinol-phosphate aminotransferase